MPTLEWIGKDKVVNHHQEVPFRVLERQYSFDENGRHAEDNGSENMIIHGDNLDALKALLPRYEGRVKCIHIDPPYNTGNEKWIYNDNVNDPKIKKWLGEVVGKEGGGSDPPRQVAVYDVPPIEVAAKAAGGRWGNFYQH